MSNIFIDQNCNLCNTYGEWITKKNTNININDQSSLGDKEFNLDTLVFKHGNKSYYFSDAVIHSIASVGNVYKTIYVLKIFPKSLRDYFYKLLSKNRHRI